MSVTAATTTAQAQEDPYATVEEQAQTSDLDTDLTPVAKETDLWTLLHGAEYPETEAIDGSATTFDTDLHAVSFRNRMIGLAGGSACAIEPIKERGETDAEFGARAAECKGTDGAQVPRVPALYRYTEPPNQDPRWDRLALPTPTSSDDADSSGYIGAIAWIDADRALIVGGTGAYPRREPSADGKAPTDPAKADPAGEARAWVYSRGADAATELDLSGLRADEPERAGMRGLSAVGCPSATLCFAGGLGQIWEWRAGEFSDRRIDAKSPSEVLRHASLFRYRVRDISGATAATAGCCAPDQSQNTPRLIQYSSASDSWSANDFSGRVGALPAVPAANVPGCAPHPLGTCLGVPIPPPIGGAPIVSQETADQANRDVDQANNSRRELNDKPQWPDSIYAISGATAILSPGGGEQVGEQASVIAPSRELLGPTPEADVTRTALSTARLLDGDGDVACIDLLRPSGGMRGKDFAGSNFNCAGPDGIPDWVAGELRSTKRPGLGARGLVVATALETPRARDAVDATAETNGQVRPTPEEITSGEWSGPVDFEKLDAYLDSRHFQLPSYTANAVDIVGTEEDGWMVGDHGAILRLSAEALRSAESASEPKPPRLGASRQRPLSDRSAYDEARPGLPSAAGIVPALGGETVPLDEPEMIPSGSAGAPVSQIVISRDGSEGWAIGSAVGGGPSFSHFDGASWSACDPLGIEGAVEPDPACEAMAPLRGFRDVNGNMRTANLSHAARVPLENDSDPTNDDELEILAVGMTPYKGPEYEGESLPTVVRYSEGRWRFEEPEAVRALDTTRNTIPGSNADANPDSVSGLAFTAPDDGWLAAGYLNNNGLRFYRFDGKRWVDCDAEPESCGDRDGRLPIRGREMTGLASAGDRVYLYGARWLELAGDAPCVALFVLQNCHPRLVPLIIYHDRGGEWSDGSGEGGDGGGFDPAFSNPATEQAGRVTSLSVAAGIDGRFDGWAVGEFSSGAQVSTLDNLGGARVPPQAVLMRLDPSSGEGWERFRSPGALEDYMLSDLVGFKPGSTSDRLQVTYPSELAPDGAFIGQEGGGGNRLFGFDAARERFELLDSGRPQFSPQLDNFWAAIPDGEIDAMAPDGRGGFWASVENYFFHYADRALKPLFEEVANPFGPRGAALRALAGGPDGSVWAATDSDRLYRYERGLGWEEARVGWDPGRVVTRASQATAIAIGPGGEGLVVGEGGRIADLSPEGVALNPAAGRSCALGDAIPCGTSRDLSAVDVAPDGSAIAAGRRLALLWRPPGGDFREIETKPRIASTAAIVSVSMPAPERAYLATDAGVIFRGELAGEGEWAWRSDNTDAAGELVTADAIGAPLSIADIAIDASGHGYAVGRYPTAGAIFERGADGEWRRLPARYGGGTVVELAETGGPGVLIGDASGRILAGSGRDLHVARLDDYPNGVAGAKGLVGLAYLPGSSEGSVDAWAGASRGGLSRLLRYRSDPGDPLLEPSGASAALPDSPARADGELSLGAFGKSDCEKPESRLCPEFSATTTTNELIARRIVDELAELRSQGEVDLALLSGDATDAAGLPASSLADLDRVGNVPSGVVFAETQRAGQLKHRRYEEMIVDELEQRGVPLFGTIGAQDLSETYACDIEHCTVAKQFANAGENLAWREAFAGRAEPWGDGSTALAADTDSEISLEPAPGSEDNSLRVEDQRADIDGDEGQAPEAKAEIGGASTHYAVDAVRDGDAIARIVFVDTSLRSLQASDPLQQPHELAGGQQRFLERMICTEGQQSTFGDRCTRAKDQKAIVVSNTPTYSYGPGALTHTALDGTAFEATMLRYDVDLVISGALGYNGLYYTLAPGVHEPCPAGEYPQGPPSGSTPDCLAGPTGPAEEVEKRLGESPAGESAPEGVSDPASLISEQGLSGVYPTLIASGAGGKFGPDGNEPADGPAGQWHGYSIARLLPSGDLVVEQRPILDWIGLDAPDHAVAPRARLRLSGYGRSPVSTTTEGKIPRTFHYEIATPAITHRYDLLLADPDEPWLACDEQAINCQELHANLTKPSPEAEANPSATGEENPCSPYLCLPSRVGVVDDQSGQVRAGDGKYPETFAIAMLSVDEEVATYPLVFKRSPAFVTSPSIRTGALPKLSGARPGSPPPPPPPPGLPQIPQVDVPQIPPPPGIPQLTAATPPELQPPTPPAPPPPSQQPVPLDLSVAPPGVSISTPTALIQPPTPPVNPAPPGGARREARQRQAAAQKGGADSSDEVSSDAQGMGGDSASAPDSPHGASMTRREPEPVRQDHYFTRMSAGSDSAPYLLWGSGFVVGAFVLAAGFSTMRPGSRRRLPEIPAPAVNRQHRH